ncbi:MAG: hypothetical protein AB7P02_02820 [Alphaproteobacteria bacterium]
MLLPKAVRAATLAVAGAFLLSAALPAAAAPVVPSAKPAGFEQARSVELVATDSKKKKPKKTAKKKTGKKTAGKKTTKKPAA